jgi:hypothetical protein
MVFAREHLPQLWATTQDNLGAAYQDRIRGDRADNLEKAIAYLEASLTVRTREALPRDHLVTAQLLGLALMEKRDWHKARAALAGARAAFLVLFGQGLDDVVNPASLCLSSPSHKAG